MHFHLAYLSDLRCVAVGHMITGYRNLVHACYSVPAGVRFVFFWLESHQAKIKIQITGRSPDISLLHALSDPY